MDRIPYGESPGGKTTESFTQKMIDANLLIEYLESKGLRAAQTRLGEYVKFYERFVTESCSDKEIQDNLLFVMREMDEWSWIYRGLKKKEMALGVTRATLEEFHLKTQNLVGFAFPLLTFVIFTGYCRKWEHHNGMELAAPNRSCRR